MFEVVVDSVRYVQDIPLEFTDQALSAGELRKGAVVGLQVHNPADCEGQILLEVRLTEDGQERLLKPGMLLPLDGEGFRYRFSMDWGDYLMRQSNGKSISGGNGKSTAKINPPCGQS